MQEMMDTTTRSPAVALLDVDGTLHPRSVGLALLDEMMQRGLGRVAHIVAVMDAVRSFRRGSIAFDEMVRTTSAAYAAALEGVHVAEIHALAQEIWPRLREQLFPFVRPLIAMLHAAQITPYLVSSSPQEIVSLLAADLGVVDSHGSRFEIVGGSYTGALLVMPGAPGGKLAILRHFAAERGADLRRSLALGNGESDFGVLGEVGRPLLFEPDASLYAQGASPAWTPVDRSNLLDRVAQILSQ